MSEIQVYFSFLLLLNCFHSLIIVSTAATCDDSPASYDRTECLAINCGFTGNKSLSLPGDRRVWIGDNAPSTLFTITHPSGRASTAQSSISKRPSDPAFDDVLYSTARISHHDFSYIFPVTAGPKFLRLHFYPASYGGGYDITSGFFSVFANVYTLLRNFSAWLSVDTYSTNQFMSMEFCIWIKEEGGHSPAIINITFAPSPSPSTPNASAFINAIEIVSMPPHLYYTADNGTGAFFGGSGFLKVEKNMSLETMFRLNAGGMSIEPQNDTGMYRKWWSDVTYTPEDTSVHIEQYRHEIGFTDRTPAYVAPKILYQTARTMGQTNDMRSRNLTWTLPLDVGFSYLLRLHFCEIEPNYTQEGDRVFQIYIDDRSEEESADVLSWTKKNDVPIYKDYAVYIGKEGSSNRRNIIVSLVPKINFSKYMDAILNGLEVFKISSSNNRSLAAPNPIPKSIPPQSQPSSSYGRSGGPNHSKTIVLATAIPGGAVLSLFSLLCLGLYLLRRPRQTFGAGKGLPSRLCRHFSLSEIRAATANFDSALIVGRGGFGDVYKGHIDGGATAVAIKRLKEGSKQGSHEFKTEIEMLSQLRHLHLVSLIGYCNDGGEMILVYAYVSRGTLLSHLYDPHNAIDRGPPLPWKQRLAICLGAARGLHHLHRGAKHTIIHRDVKTTNILLDDKWVAKVSDFGLSKLGPTNAADDHVSTLVKGSFGYLDPEYFRRQQLTEKSDVYSFGVVLLEVLCGRPPVNQALSRNEVSLAVWARINYEEGSLDRIVDPCLDGQIAPDCLTKFTEIAMGCLHDEGIGRPMVDHVVGGLELVLQLQEDADKGIKRVDCCVDEVKVDCKRGLFGSGDGHVLEPVLTPSSSVWESSALLVGSAGTPMSEDSERLASGEGTVFSEIINPNAR